MYIQCDISRGKSLNSDAEPTSLACQVHPRFLLTIEDRSGMLFGIGLG